MRLLEGLQDDGTGHEHDHAAHFMHMPVTRIDVLVHSPPHCCAVIPPLCVAVFEYFSYRHDFVEVDSSFDNV
ncbi:hypothetical protein E2C01_082406 [Portunus trituberculatus]|uniref:Uncharacterized protein n=1 Tax=Portunus trituberculatus TaxID=210409 RepID=A0A5B7IPV0_PORTR|nr:hypothetical protein [Portunus trituberculatus]